MLTLKTNKKEKIISTLMRGTTKIGNETGTFITVTYFTDFGRSYREYDKQLHANGWEKLKENNKFLESYELLN